MAIHLPTSTALLLEVPRTGSRWLRVAIRAAGVKHRQVGPPKWRGPGDLSVHGRKYSKICCFVRDPVTWLTSYWARCMVRGWRPNIPSTANAHLTSFFIFGRNVTSKFPGFVGAM